LENEQKISTPLSASDPVFGFSHRPRKEVTFDRGVDCPKCGQHKAPPSTEVTMTVTADSRKEVAGGVLTEYFPVDWQIADSQGGVVSGYNDYFMKIEWSVGTFTGEVSRTYTIMSPEKTTPPTDYDFFSSVDGVESDYWTIKVADPNVVLQSCAANINSAVEDTFGGSCDGGADSTNTFLNADDTSVETHPSQKKFAGVKITTNNWGVSDCVSISNVSLNYKWWTTTSDSDVAHYIAVSRDGTNWVNAVDVALPTSEPGSVSSVDATSLVAWTCADFGAAGTAAIKSNVKDGTNVSYNYNWDVLYYAVTYVANGTLSFSITNPPADNNTSVNNNTDFLVSGSTTCNTNNCGSVDTTLQYCIGAGCSNWMDVNSDVGSPLLLVSGSQPQNNANLTAGNSYNVSWVVKSNIADTYELRFSGTGSTATAGTSSGTDRTITTQAVANDYSFTLSLPSSGCTQGEGSIDAGTSCDKGYFETTDLSGAADETKVDAQGQTTTTPLFVYDNQSTTSSDLNITMDLNVSLPATLKLKVSSAYSGWAASCNGNPADNCVEITTSAPSIGKALYTTGTQDLNIFLWADYVAATVGAIDRNVTSTGVSPT
ncbi:MAG: hypothetical protein NUV67_01525, partial [archaeon]|nr:hypothetical protein [archaeon]